MAKEKGGSSVPFAAVAAVLFAVGGAVFYFSPLTSPRPEASIASIHSAFGEQKVDARLWNDPFNAIAELQHRKSEEKDERPLLLKAFGIKERLATDPHLLAQEL